MKAYVVKCLVIDFEDIGHDEIVEQISRTKYICPGVFETEELEIGEWSDLHPLNSINVSEEVLNLFRRSV